MRFIFLICILLGAPCVFAKPGWFDWLFNWGRGNIAAAPSQTYSITVVEDSRDSKNEVIQQLVDDTLAFDFTAEARQEDAIGLLDNLMTAIEEANPHAIKVMEWLRQTNSRGRNLFHIAALFSVYDFLERISHFYAACNAPNFLLTVDHEGYSPLRMALMRCTYTPHDQCCFSWMLRQIPPIVLLNVFRDRAEVLRLPLPLSIAVSNVSPHSLSLLLDQVRKLKRLSLLNESNIDFDSREKLNLFLYAFAPTLDLFNYDLNEEAEETKRARIACAEKVFKFWVEIKKGDFERFLECYSMNTMILGEAIRTADNAHAEIAGLYDQIVVPYLETPDDEMSTLSATLTQITSNETPPLGSSSRLFASGKSF